MVLKQQLSYSIQHTNNNIQFIKNLQMISPNHVSLHVRTLFEGALHQKSIFFFFTFSKSGFLLFVVYESINQSYDNKNQKQTISVLLIIFDNQSMEGVVTIQQSKTTMLERYQATMVLAAVGDAMGYRGGSWQFTFDGALIHQELMEMTKDEGIQGLYVQRDGFPYSDDTVMHIATAKALVQSEPEQQLETICVKLAKHYKACMSEMTGRAPGGTCIRSANKLHKNGENWKDIRFEKHGGGCGASMRAACIGLYFFNNPQKLVSVSIESGRITHHNPLGYLGALVAALFTAFAIKEIPPKEWFRLLMEDYLPLAKDYVAAGREAEQNLSSGDWDFFVQRLTRFGEIRGMLEKTDEPTFPEKYGVKQREEQYKQFSVNGWPGALGLDSVIIAYDALLSSLDYARRQKQKGVEINLWEQICLRGMLHGGDSDSTGTIVGAWYGALYGYKDVYESNYAHSEKKEFIEQLGTKIYHKVNQTQPK